MSTLFSHIGRMGSLMLKWKTQAKWFTNETKSAISNPSPLQSVAYIWVNVPGHHACKLDAWNLYILSILIEPNFLDF